MGELKTLQPSMTIDEQINNLKKIGLIIENEEYAKIILNDISYFRLIKAFSLQLKEKNGNYYDFVTFEQLVNLYLFNSNFRHLIFAEIEKIEINTRCRISNYVSNKYDILGYKEKSNFVNEIYHQIFIKEIKGEIKRNSKALFVKNFKKNYVGGDLPMYAIIELFSFGMLSKFYKNMKNTDKKEIATTFGVCFIYFESWLESIAYTRNICAHYGRLYNAKLTKTPIMYKEYKEMGILNNRIFGVILCMKIILRNDSHWNEFVNNLKLLLFKYKNINLKTMGFPKNWEELLIY